MSDKKDSIAVGNSVMPAVGLGLWKVARQDTAQNVYDAVQAGYRHLDSACDYGNEKEVGEGIARAVTDGLCRRDDLWVTSKLWNTYHRREHVRPALQRTLDDLGLDYLDLYLVHFPIALRYVPFDERYPPEWQFDPESANPSMQLDAVPIQETWQEMERAVSDGLVRHIGVCNFNSGLLHDLLSYAKTGPDMLQIEAHPYLTQEPLLRMCRERGIAVTAFSPLGALSYVPLDMADRSETVLESAVVLAIARRTGRTPAQVVLRWGVQRGTAVIPKTSRKERLAENLGLFDFTLSDDDMNAIAALNQNRRFNDPGVFCEQGFGTFHPIYD